MQHVHCCWAENSGTGFDPQAYTGRDDGLQQGRISGRAPVKQFLRHHMHVEGLYEGCIGRLRQQLLPAAPAHRRSSQCREFWLSELLG